MSSQARIAGDEARVLHRAGPNSLVEIVDLRFEILIANVDARTKCPPQQKEIDSQSGRASTRSSLRGLHRGLHGPRFTGLSGTSDPRNDAVPAQPGGV
jgi:hypothetical protein